MHLDGFPGDPPGNASACCGQVNALLTEPTWPYPRQPRLHWRRSNIGRSKPNANSRGVTPNARTGGGPAATTENRHGSPTLTLGRINTGALLTSSCFLPLKPTRARSGLSAGSHPASSPTVTEPKSVPRSSSIYGGCRPLRSVDDVKYLSAHASGLSKLTRWL